jgi:hypothetical protein
MVLDDGSCRVAGEVDEHGGGENDEGDGVHYAVHGGGKVAHILHVGSGEGLVQNRRDSGVLFERRREKQPGTEDTQTPNQNN